MYKYFFKPKTKSVFNWTFCQLLTEKPNCTKLTCLGQLGRLTRNRNDPLSVPCHCQVCYSVQVSPVYTSLKADRLCFEQGRDAATGLTPTLPRLCGRAKTSTFPRSRERRETPTLAPGATERCV